MTEIFTPAFVAQLSEGNPLREAEDGFPTIRLKLELAGHDPGDEELVADAVRAVRYAMQDRRASRSLLGRFSALKLTDAQLGDLIGLPRSSTQAIASGRKPERLSKAQKHALGALCAQHIAVCQKIIDETGYGL